MKHVLLVTILTAVAACASREATYSGDTAGGTGSASAPARRPGVPLSDLSPAQVRLVQRSLIDRGFAVDPTGTFDDRTRAALMDFQRARGLPATASIDRPTVDALGLDPHQVLPVRGAPR